MWKSISYRNNISLLRITPGDVGKANAMKARSILVFLLTIVFFLVSVRPTTAQTSPRVDNPPDTVHILTQSQKQAIKRIQEESKKRAAPTALKFATIVRKIYENMLAEKP